jgi:hypothetical protein
MEHDTRIFTKEKPALIKVETMYMGAPLARQSLSSFRSY